jgi:hypothetical protein
MAAHHALQHVGVHFFQLAGEPLERRVRALIDDDPDRRANRARNPPPARSGQGDHERHDRDGRITDEPVARPCDLGETPDGQQPQPLGPHILHSGLPQARDHASWGK